MSAVINERLCRQLVGEYFRRTKKGESQAMVLRELMQVTYAQGNQAAILAVVSGKEVENLRIERDTLLHGMRLADNKVLALEADAERYRILRDPAYQMQEDDPCVTDDSFNTFFEEDLDKAVDALKARYDSEMVKGSD